MASPTFIGTAVTGGNSNGTSLTLNKPASSAVDEYLLSAQTLENLDSITAPSGWSLLFHAEQAGPAVDYQFNAWWRRVDGSEGSNFTWSWTNSNHRSGYIVRLNGGVTGVTPFEASSDLAVAGATTNSADTTGIVPVTIETLLLLIQADTGASGSVSGGPTERVDFNRVYLATEALAAAGATGARSVALSASQWWVLGTYALMSVAPSDGRPWPPRLIVPPASARHRLLLP
jgi:hypothetical protein